VRLRDVVVEAEMSRSTIQVLGKKPAGTFELREKVTSYIKDGRYKFIKDSKMQTSRPVDGGGVEAESVARRSVSLCDGSSECEANRPDNDKPYRLESLKPVAEGRARTGPAIADLYFYSLPQVSYFGIVLLDTLKNKSLDNYRTTEIRTGGKVAYKIFFHLKSKDGENRGWWLVNPDRSWALEKFDLTHERKTAAAIHRQLLKGTVAYREQVDEFPRPESVEYHQRVENEMVGPNKAELVKQDVATSSVDKRTTIAYSDYRLEQKPDREFSLASIGLGYAEVPVGPPRDHSWVFLAIFAVVCLCAGIVLKARTRKHRAA
jgi:hypothetical protein